MSELVDILIKQFNEDVRRHVDAAYWSYDEEPAGMQVSASKIIQACAESMAASIIVAKMRQEGLI